MTILPSIANSLRKKIQQMAVHVSPSKSKQASTQFLDRPAAGSDFIATSVVNNKPQMGADDFSILQSIACNVAFAARFLIEQKCCPLHANSARPPRWAASFLSSRFRRLFPFPFAGLRVVTGGTAFDHLVAESDARHDERGEIATAKAECAEGKNDDKFQQRLTHRPVLLRQYLKP
jgi:hypothetical protein